MVYRANIAILQERQTLFLTYISIVVYGRANSPLLAREAWCYGCSRRQKASADAVVGREHVDEESLSLSIPRTAISA
jgi:hypothetical protein